jgi:hypothetical protein
VTAENLLSGMTEKETEWKNIDDNVNENTLNLTISRRIIEGQGGVFQVAAGDDHRIQITIALPIDRAS